MSPGLSIVTVSFNARNVIEKTLRSVAMQDYPGIEYIVIDGGSTDGTQEIIGRYMDRIAYYVSEYDGGIYFGMNKGLRAATGEYVLFLNAGDVFPDSKVLSDAAGFISQHPEADAVFGDSERVMEYGNYRIKPDPKGLEWSMSVCHQSLFVKRTVLLAHPFDTTFRYSADFEQVSALYLEGKAFVHFDRLVSVVEMQDGATYNHYIESTNELFDIIAARGVDVSRMRKSQLRRKRIVRSLRTGLPRWLRDPLFRLTARLYKVL